MDSSPLDVAHGPLPWVIESNVDDASIPHRVKKKELVV